MTEAEAARTANAEKLIGLRLALSGPDADAPVVFSSPRKSKRKPPQVKAVGQRAVRTRRGIAQSRVALDDLKGFIEGASFENLAREENVTARKIIERLPSAMRQFAPRGALIKILNDIALWGRVTVMLGSPEGAVEITGHLPRGEEANGYFYWLGEGPIRGRLRLDRCGDVAFVVRPFMGRDSASVVFFNLGGDIMLKVLLARKHDITEQEQQLAAMRMLAKRVCRPSV